MSDVDDEIDLLAYEFDESTNQLIKSYTPLESPQDPPKKIRASVSLAKAYQTCPAQAYARITKQKGSKNFALITGIAVHETLEAIIKRRVDPKAFYKKVFAEEAERNSLLLTAEDADSSFATGSMCLENALSENILYRQMENGQQFIDWFEPHLTEVSFSFVRKGRVWVGKLDQLFRSPLNNQGYILDWKTGRNSPGDFELDSDTQFSVYPEGVYQDEKLKAFGFGWVGDSTYMHLRGKTVEKTDTGATSRKKGARKQYAFRTKRTQEQVEKDFVQTLDPVMDQIEDGRWYRNQGKACSYCSYFNKAKKRCEAEIPSDNTGRDQSAHEELRKVQVEQAKSQTVQTLFDQATLEASKPGTLKPYA